MNAQPCRVCRGEACGSSERCTCGHCINCDLTSSTSLCPRCQANQECDCCHRHLPSHCYTNNSNRCNTCTKKLSQTHYRTSIGNIVHEASIPTARSTHSFDAFVSTNSDVIAALVDDYQRQYRYVRETSNFFCHLACIGVASTKSLNFACGLCVADLYEYKLSLIHI